MVGEKLPLHANLPPLACFPLRSFILDIHCDLRSPIDDEDEDDDEDDSEARGRIKPAILGGNLLVIGEKRDALAIS